MSISQEIDFTHSLKPEKILPTQLAFSFNTKDSCKVVVKYGETIAFEKGEKVSYGKKHLIELNNLKPSGFYYCKPLLINSADTVWGETGFYSTASAVPGSIKVYFNHSVDTTVSHGVNAVYLNNTFDDTLIAYIQRAKTSIDFAIYNTNNAQIVSAVNAAANSGIQVRYIAEGSVTNSGLNNLNASVPVLKRTNTTTGSGMHNKFVVIDANDSINATVISGSTNFTTSSFFDDYNNIIIINDMSVAKAYQTEFEEMWGGSGPQPNAANSKFGPAKTDNTPHTFNVNGTIIEVYFSPSDKTNNVILNTINSSEYEFQFATYSFTRNDLGDAVVSKSNQIGNMVKGIIEQTSSSFDEYSYLLSKGVNVFSHEGFPNLLHHKYCIVDQGQSFSDPLVLTGSHNWSTSAETANDENTLIIHDYYIANQYYQEFVKRFKELGGVVGETVFENSLQVSVYPNPASDGFCFIDIPADDLSKISEIKIFNIAGQIIYESSFSANDTFPFTINLPENNGVYVLAIQLKNGNHIFKKIILQ